MRIYINPFICQFDISIGPLYVNPFNSKKINNVVNKIKATQCRIKSKVHFMK